MFGRGKNDRKNEQEFVTMLAELAGISENRAQEYYNKNAGFIKQSYNRGLDTFGAMWHIANASMEKIAAAHQINELEHLKDIPNYMLLVSLHIAKFMEKKLPSSDVAKNNRYFFAVLSIPIDAAAPERKYADLLDDLVRDYNLRN